MCDKVTQSCSMTITLDHITHDNDGKLREFSCLNIEYLNRDNRFQRTLKTVNTINIEYCESN